MAIKSFEEMRKIDLTPYTKKRDEADYVNWAVIKQLLHDNGAEKVYFTPLTNEQGSSLFMSDMEFKDKNGMTNRCYETAVKVVIDDLEFIQRGPVTNGSNPVKDNSMSQQRLWNAQTRLFAKGVAIMTGLGFDLWSRIETQEENNTTSEEDLSKHNIIKVAERVKEKITSKLKMDYSLEEIAEKLDFANTEELNAVLSYYNILNRLEQRLDKIDKKQK